MPRKPMPWFRFYVEMFGDRKVRRLTPAQRWAWAAMLGAARESPEPGVLYVADGLPMTVKELAALADVRLGDARKAVDMCIEMGMVSIDDKGLISVTNWDKRQPESDNVTARVAAYRERSKEQGSNVSGNVATKGGAGSESDTTSTRTEQKSGPKSARSAQPNRSSMAQGSDSEVPVEPAPHGAKERSNVVTRNDSETNAFRASAPAAELEKRLNSTTSLGSGNVPAGAVPRIIRIYVDACRDAGVPAPEESQGRVERSARSLLTQDYPLADIEDAARNAAVGGWTDLTVQLQRDAARASPATNGRTSTADARFQAGLDLADQLERKAIT